MKISAIKPNPNNPRLIKDDKFLKLCNSLKDFPKMMELRPIIVDESNMILGGNMRFRALKELGYKELPDEWVKRASELNEDEKQRFIISDNSNFGEWDYEQLANLWDAEKLSEWGVNLVFLGSEFNNMNEDDLNLNEEFDPVGISKDCQRVVFIFNNKELAEKYLKEQNLKFEKRNMAWQVNMNIQYI